MARPRIQSLTVSILAAVIYVSPVSASTCSQDEDVWKKSIDGKKRFIPVELWTGVHWDGRTDLGMSTVDAEYSHLDRPYAGYRITGPKPWNHPILNQTFLVYERISPVVEEKKPNRSQIEGLKFQRFTKNKDNSGLGRLYDSRPIKNSPKLANETDLYSGGLKFPLGQWLQGNRRQLIFDEFIKGNTAKITEEIRITKIDFLLNRYGYKHCLEFEWKKIRESVVKDFQTYTYCPCQSMVDAIDHMKQPSK